MKKSLAAMTLALAFALPAQAGETAITIYSKAQPGSVNPNLYRPVPGVNQGYNYSHVPGYAVVRHQREVNLPNKKTRLRFQDVAALLDPTTVQFKSLTDPKNTKVAEQNYQFDLVSRQKLLQKYIDKEITVEYPVGDKVETVKGVLMSTDGGITLKTDKGEIRAINSYSNIIFSELPGGLITKPTLVWDIFAKKKGKHKTEVSYQTEGITWWADYNLTYREGKNANKGEVDFGSWVSIINKTGATYNGAKLKLMAGDVQRKQNNQVYSNASYRAAVPMMEMADDEGFKEKAFFEYHLYTLGRPADIPDNSTKQLELIPTATGVPVEKLLVYVGSSTPFYGGYNTDRNYGTQGNKKVDVYLKFKNKKENGLGVPLPSGRIRVNQADSDGSLEFIGEDLIDHTAKNEEVLIKLGSAFDVVGERKQTDFFIDTNRKIIEEEFEIKLRNQKDKKVKVLVKESLYRAANWKVIKKSDKFEKENSNTIHFNTEIGPEKEKVITYKVRYTW